MSFFLNKFFIAGFFVLCVISNTSAVTYVLTSEIYRATEYNPNELYCTSYFTVIAPAEVNRGDSFTVSTEAGPGLCANRPVDFDSVFGQLDTYPSLFAIFKRYGSQTGATAEGIFTPPATGNFTAEVEVYSSTFYSLLGDSEVMSLVVQVQDNIACSDSLNNDGAEGADTLDPQCHSDCNANNTSSYVPTHDSESTQAGTCPAPTLNLSGRAAALFKLVAAVFTESVFAEGK